MMEGKDGGERMRMKIMKEVKILGFKKLGKCGIKIKMRIEIIIDERIVEKSKENKVLNKRIERLVKEILDEGFVKKSKNLIRDGFG